ncbi:Peptidoglycan/xylan/chitin deacetylase, PgdA/CDA1 family [Bradyrhizobium lablabi]|uniref:Chitooligosaccharide deacetylase n=2 Tax=Bradyrhizobium TaxID=374 RepID=A0ABY0QDS3_9BRAD|nr:MULTISPECIES: polysaccharide deacetylase family protein [Bradyrhizobium]SDK00396.1 Peptidoglycan/xylan/chitin deacetylase, PgdA/CDA1 family [Bradyrhizobium ottawaense]SEB90096.1 Peptidoglycan/xylan/chitin deacetylase, PgdA/CDA1 family [Bradyrhizobium lablabi]SHM61746.1 Peptidoglycan/xylan/chitin deacetylase, PgdA/CDA1 family [Bradyrhizobium lablabi]
MIASVGVRHRGRISAALCLSVLALIPAQRASAADCPGHPDALGTSRTLVVDPREYPIIGTMQYAKTLPLQDHEVVLTFDDGPIPKNSYQVLQILADQCVKATFFLVGAQARANPGGVRKVRDAGHTVATHTQNHPSNMQRMPIDRAQKEIDDGIASVTAALADGTGPAPFFRIPGLGRNDAIETYAESKGIQVWSADFPADDWRRVSPQRVYDLAIQRLEAKGKGILLLHDIQARTVAALPKILQTLKARGYRIVHVVPATPERPATPTEPQQWQLHPTSETVAISRWPKVPNFAYAATSALPAPAWFDFDWRDAELGILTRRMRGVPLAQRTQWPRELVVAENGAATVLPVPAASLFNMPESTGVTMLGTLRRTEQAAQAALEAEASARLAPVQPGKSRRPARGALTQQAHGGQTTAKPAAHQSRHAAHAGRGVPQQAVQGKKKPRSVRVAGLKKR